MLFTSCSWIDRRDFAQRTSDGECADDGDEPFDVNLAARMMCDEPWLTG